MNKKPKHTCPTCGAAMLFPLNAGSGLDDSMTHWIDGLELDGRAASYIRKLRQRARDYIAPYFRSSSPEDIRTIHVSQFHQHLRKQSLASKTIKHILDALRAFLSHLHRLEAIDRMPLFPRLSVETVKPKGWIDRQTQDDVLALIAPRHHPIFQVLIETGIRPGEACALRRRDLQDGSLVIERAVGEKGEDKATKTGRSWTVPLSTELYQSLIDNSRLMMPEAPLFTDKGKPYSGVKLYWLWRRAGEKIEIHVPLYQAFRHSKVSQRRAELEASMRTELKQMLGHTHATTTMKHYALPGDRKVTR